MFVGSRLVQLNALETLIVLESEAESRRNEVRPLLAQHATAADLISIARVIDPSLLSRSDSSFRGNTGRWVVAAVAWGGGAAAAATSEAAVEWQCVREQQDVVRIEWGASHATLLLVARPVVTDSHSNHTAVSSTDWQTDKQSDRQTVKQTDRQTIRPRL